MDIIWPCSIFISISAIEIIISCYDKSCLHSLCIGPPNCSVSLTASRLTADKSVIRWVFGSCLGALPMIYTLWWHPVGKTLSQGNSTSINSSMASDNYYTITGLLSNTRYFIVLTLRGQNYQCAGGVGASYSAISETLISGEFTTMFIWTAFVYWVRHVGINVAQIYTLHGSRGGSRIPLGNITSGYILCNSQTIHPTTLNTTLIVIVRNIFHMLVWTIKWSTLPLMK